MDFAILRLPFPKGWLCRLGKAMIALRLLIAFLSVGQHTAATSPSTHSETGGTANAAKLVPPNMVELMGDAAEQMANLIRQRKLELVGLLDCTTTSKPDTLPRRPFGLLGAYCAEELACRLAQQAAGEFTILDRSRLRALFRDQGAELSAAYASANLEKVLKNPANRMTGIIGLTLIDCRDAQLTIRLQLHHPGGNPANATVEGRAMLRESEWAMLGLSVQVRTEDLRPEPPPKPFHQTLIERLERRALGPHPLVDPTFPFPMKVMIGGKERKPVFRGNDCFVPVRKAEVYEIWVENRRRETVFMRLLVDGLNTLPEQENRQGLSFYVMGKRVSLNDAMPWIMDSSPVYAVRGFFTKLGESMKLREFTVVEAEESLGDQRSGGPAGIISAAFYLGLRPRSIGARVGSSLGRGMDTELGTGAGREHELSTGGRLGPAWRPGPLLAVVHLRYVDADRLEQAIRSPAVPPQPSGAERP